MSLAYCQLCPAILPDIMSRSVHSNVLLPAILLELTKALQLGI